jgi:serine protease Do
MEPFETPPPVSPPRQLPAFRLSTAVLAVTLAILVGVLVLYAVPGLLLRWWLVQAQAEADATYLKRQAELKAESEAADQRLAALDRRVHFVSLGFRDVARKVAPVVVNVRNEVELDDPDEPGYFDFDTRRTYAEQGEGSGLLVKPGFVLTNNHVVKKANRLRVVFANGASVAVTPDAVAADPLTDLAVIRLPRRAAGRDYGAAAEFADSDKDVQVGDWTLAVGSPFGLKQTVTAGIISAKGRIELGILDQVELLQTDAAINPGNSGGPLFDQRGRVVGVNVAIASKSGTNQGVGFAIPSNTARAIFDQLAAKGEVVRGFLGIAMQELTDDLGRRLGVSDTGGVYVRVVRPGTPAHAAGLRAGDVVTRYNHVPVGADNAVNQLRRRIADTVPATTVPVEIVRDKKRVTLHVTIAKRAKE